MAIFKWQGLTDKISGTVGNIIFTAIRWAVKLLWLKIMLVGGDRYAHPLLPLKKEPIINRSRHTLPYVLKYNTHATTCNKPVACCWKSLGTQTPKPNKLYAIILITSKLTCDIIHLYTKLLYLLLPCSVSSDIYLVSPWGLSLISVVLQPN